MISFLKLYGYDLENREDIHFILTDSDGFEYSRDYKQFSFPFICKDCKISIYTNRNLKKRICSYKS